MWNCTAKLFFLIGFLLAIFVSNYAELFWSSLFWSNYERECGMRQKALDVMNNQYGKFAISLLTIRWSLAMHVPNWQWNSFLASSSHSPWTLEATARQFTMQFSCLHCTVIWWFVYVSALRVHRDMRNRTFFYTPVKKVFCWIFPSTHFNRFWFTLRDARLFRWCFFADKARKRRKICKKKTKNEKDIFVWNKVKVKKSFSFPQFLSWS